MTSLLPAFYFPGLVLIIDDDIAFIKSTERYLNHYCKNSKFIGYTSTREALPTINKLKSFSLEDYYGSEIFADYDKNITYVAHSFGKILSLKDLKKKEIISVIVVDYKMPYQDGLTFLSEMQCESFSKILLTGAMTDQSVIDAFNNSLIDFYVNKGTAKSPKILLSKIQSAQMNFFINQTRFLTDVILKDEESCLLNQELYKNLVLHFIEKYNIKEFYLFDSIGSYFLKSDSEDYILFVTEETKHQALVNVMEDEFSNATHDSKSEFEQYLVLMKSEKITFFERPFIKNDFSNFESIKYLFHEAKILYCGEKRYLYFFSKNCFQKNGKDSYYIS